MQPTEPCAENGGRPDLSAERASQLLERVITVYERAFAQESAGRVYLGRLGITDAGVSSCHRFGYSNGQLHELLPEEGPISRELEAVGILLDGKQERLAGCVVVPTCDPDGQLKNLCGLRIGPEIPECAITPD